MIPSSLERLAQSQLCVTVPKRGYVGEGEGKPVSSTTYTSEGGICPLPTPTQIPWPVLPGRGRRGILKSMTAENKGVI